MEFVYNFVYTITIHIISANFKTYIATNDNTKNIYINLNILFSITFLLIIRLKHRIFNLN